MAYRWKRLSKRVAIPQIVILIESLSAREVNLWQAFLLLLLLLLLNFVSSYCNHACFVVILKRFRWVSSSNACKKIMNLQQKYWKKVIIWKKLVYVFFSCVFFATKFFWLLQIHLNLKLTIFIISILKWYFKLKSFKHHLI